jgi:hypothetical protein
MLVAGVSKDHEAQKIVAEGLDAIIGWTEHEAMTFIEPRMQLFMNDDSEEDADM